MGGGLGKLCVCASVRWSDGVGWKRKMVGCEEWTSDSTTWLQPYPLTYSLLRGIELGYQVGLKAFARSSEIS